MRATGHVRPALMVLGGFAGAGKTTLARRLSSELGIPALSSDTIGQSIKMSQGVEGNAVNAYWIAYDVLFTLCEEFVRSRISVILDLSMGWAFQWERLDAITGRHPEISCLPIILRCPKDHCMERMRARHASAPSRHDPPEPYTLSPQLLQVWDYLERLDRPDAHFVDAARSQDEVYEDVKRYLA